MGKREGETTFPPKGPPLRLSAFTAVPNTYYDYYVPLLPTMGACKVLDVIMRHTLGYGHRRRALLTIDALCKATGLHREEVIRGLRAVGNWNPEGLGLVWRRRATLADFQARRAGFGYIYGLVAEIEDSAENPTFDSAEKPTIDRTEKPIINSTEKPTFDRGKTGSQTGSAAHAKETRERKRERNSSSPPTPSSPAAVLAGPWAGDEEEERIAIWLYREAIQHGFQRAMLAHFIDLYPPRYVAYACCAALEKVKHPKALWTYLEKVLKSIEEAGAAFRMYVQSETLDNLKTIWENVLREKGGKELGRLPGTAPGETAAPPEEAGHV